MFLQGLKVEQLEEMKENLTKELANKSWNSAGYFDKKRQLSEITLEIQKRNNLINIKNLLKDL